MNESPLKTATFRAFEASGLIALAEACARGVPILAYHGVTEKPDGVLGNLRRLHVPRAQFEEHMGLLAGRWRPIPLSTLAASLQSRETLPRRSVVVTVDDGYRNALTVALPILQRHGVPATVFVLTRPQRRLWIDRLEAAVANSAARELGWNGQTFTLSTPAERREAIRALLPRFELMRDTREADLARLRRLLGDPEEVSDDDRDLLTWAEVRALGCAGLEIGSHADLHEPLTERGLDEARSALRLSYAALEGELGPGRYSLSYPFGAWNAPLATAAREAGFVSAVTGDPGLNRGGTDPFALRRFLVGADDDRSRLRSALSGLRALWTRNPWLAR